MVRRLVVVALAALVALAFGPASMAQNIKPKALRVAVVTFFSGSGTISGVPEANFAKMTIDEINRPTGSSRRRPGGARSDGKSRSSMGPSYLSKMPKPSMYAVSR